VRSTGNHWVPEHGSGGDRLTGGERVCGCARGACAHGGSGGARTMVGRCCPEVGALEGLLSVSAVRSCCPMAAVRWLLSDGCCPMAAVHSCCPMAAVRWLLSDGCCPTLGRRVDKPPCAYPDLLSEGCLPSPATTSQQIDRQQCPADVASHSDSVPMRRRHRRAAVGAVHPLRTTTLTSSRSARRRRRRWWKGGGAAVMAGGDGVAAGVGGHAMGAASRQSQHARRGAATASPLFGPTLQPVAAFSRCT
jgi:hypothetical protein